jgi:competence protein ComEA
MRVLTRSASATARSLNIVLVLFSWTAAAQTLPDGPGKDVVQSVCSLCHDAATAVIGKQWTKAQWELKISEMLQEEPDVTADERAAILQYLSTNFRPGGKIYINQSAAKVLETALDISSKAAEAIVRHRDKNGHFKTLEDLKKVPDLDAVKVEGKKDLIVF